MHPATGLRTVYSIPSVYTIQYVEHRKAFYPRYSQLQPKSWGTNRILPSFDCNSRWQWLWQNDNHWVPQNCMHRHLTSGRPKWPKLYSRSQNCRDNRSKSEVLIAFLHFPSFHSNLVAFDCAFAIAPISRWWCSVPFNYSSLEIVSDSKPWTESFGQSMSMERKSAWAKNAVN